MLKVLRLLAAVFSAAVCGLSVAQDFPVKPVRIIVPTSAGGIGDVATRVMASGMSKALGQPVIVENRIADGYEYVAARVPPDGYTLASATTNLGTMHLFEKDLKFDPTKDLPAVSLVVEGAVILASPAVSPWNNVPELIAYAKANPGKLNWAVIGLASAGALNAYAFTQRNGLNIQLIPYKSTAEVINSLFRNDTQVNLTAEGLALNGLAEKKLKLFAVSTAQRLPDLPNTPTLTELGYPEIIGFYIAIAAPRRTPAPVVAKLYASIAAMLKEKEARDLFAKLKLYVVGTGPEASNARIDQLIEVWTQIAKRAEIKP